MHPASRKPGNIQQEPYAFLMKNTPSAGFRFCDDTFGRTCTARRLRARHAGSARLGHVWTASDGLLDLDGRLADAALLTALPARRCNGRRATDEARKRPGSLGGGIISSGAPNAIGKLRPEPTVRRRWAGSNCSHFREAEAVAECSQLGLPMLGVGTQTELASASGAVATWHAPRSGRRVRS